MQIYVANDVQPDGRGLCARQSRLAGLLFGSVMIGVFCAAPLFLWYQGAPWLFSVAFGLFGLLIVPLLIGDLVARFRRTNWLLWLAPDGVWINLRSYQATNRSTPPSLAFLEYSEIASAGQRVASSITRRKNGRNTHHKDSTLELQLTEPETDRLQHAIELERALALQPRRIWGGVTITNRGCMPPVSVPQPGQMRVLWRTGRGHYASPSLKKVLIELSQHGVTIVEPVRIKPTDLTSCSPSSEIARV